MLLSTKLEQDGDKDLNNGTQNEYLLFDLITINHMFYYDFNT